MDAQYDQFVARFGNFQQQQIEEEKLPKRPELKPVSTLVPSTDVEAVSKDPEGLLQASASKGLVDESALATKTTGAKGMGATNVAMGLLDVAPDVMGIIDNAKGGQFDTSAEGPGVGKRDGAVMQGAGQGAKVGQAIGQFAGPLGSAIGTGVGALAGGAISWAGHDKAKKEYQEERRKFNKNETAMERAQNAENYAMSEGLASIEGLKELRKKQLGLIS